MKNFCPQCGSEQGPFVKNFCVKCFTQARQLLELPPVVELPHCPHCNKVRFREKWVGQSEADLQAILVSKARVRELASPRFSVELSPQENGTTQALVTVRGKMDGAEVAVQRLTLIKPLSGTCDSCMKLSSYYHESIVQLRFPKDLENDEVHGYRSLVKAELDRMREEDPLSGLIDSFVVPKGLDFFIGSKHAGKKLSLLLARKTHGKITRSFKLMGVNKSGKEKKRYTFCVRVK
ncbi:MAG TPA: hypothetical protein HA252_05140 [Candidatus Diapherotrites archaeon]|uniref:Nmd3 N-terminal domain-containing protein n=1 Tax=Candidatus Iainarchaeum sp. TaxID=3101447 RepID=A0A7J4JKA4_9ARCH|nr:hypothetical protein [Candidatus Diapherotrites archaeon]